MTNIELFFILSIKYIIYSTNGRFSVSYVRCRSFNYDIREHKKGVRVRVVQKNNIYYNEMRALEFVSQQLKP